MCEFDVMIGQDRFIQYSEGEFQKRKEVVHTVILHKINFINSK